MAPQFAYLIPIIAAFVGLFVLGLFTAIGSISRKCEDCGQEFLDDLDLNLHKKACSHKGTARISKAA